MKSIMAYTRNDDARMKPMPRKITASTGNHARPNSAENAGMSSDHAYCR